MNAKEHLTKLLTYNNRLAEIAQDRRYTDAGKAPMIEAIRAEMLAQVERLPIDLTAEYKQARRDFEQAEQAIQQARQAWADGWDYSRLNYVREQVSAQVHSARDMYQVHEAYRSAAGDRYQLRAWHEIGAALARDRFGVEASELVTMAKQAGEALSRTPETVKAEQAGEAVARRVMELRADTLSIAETLHAAGFGFKSYQVAELGKTIEQHNQWTAEGVKTSVSFADEAPAAGDAPAAPASAGATA